MSLKNRMSAAPLAATPRNLALVALAYFAFGRLALMLAIPPGYAAPVWPAAGLAVAAVMLCGARIWPGVFAGSLLINFYAGYAPGLLSPGVVVSSSILIAAGASLQALTAGVLVRLTLGQGSLLDSGTQVTRFLIVAGPVACLVNALIGPLSLVTAGIIAPDYFLATVWNWWIGDTIGVIVVAPLVVIASGRAGAHWAKRRLEIAVPMALAIALVITTYVNTSNREALRIDSQFRADAATAGAALVHKLASVGDVIASLRGFFGSSSHVSEQEFRTFADALLQRRPYLHALSWGPMLTDAERWELEQPAAGASRPLRIVERDDYGNLVPAAPADNYVVVRYIEPLDGNATALGFNLLSEPERRRAIERSLATTEAVATGGVKLVQNNSGQIGLLVFAPVYPAGNGGVQGYDWRASGFVTAVVLVDDLVASALARLPLEMLSMRLYDASAGGALLGDWSGEDQQPPVLHATQDISFAHRDWRFEISAGRNFIGAHRSDSLWVILTGGLLLSGMLGAFLIVITGHTFRERERRDELERVNRSLKDNVTLRQRIQNELWVEKARAEATLHSIADGVIAISPQHCVEYMNPVAEQLTGWSLDEAHGRPVDAVFRIRAESDGEALVGAVELCLQHGDDPAGSGELWLAGRDGSDYAIRQSTRRLSMPGMSSSGLVIAFQDVTAARRLAREMQHQATHDPLTGVVNRAEFQRRLQLAIDGVGERGGSHVVCFMDLDHFKQVNDSAGHSAGDELLRGICGCIRKQVRAHDTLARLGGDEFGLLLEHCPLDQARVIAGRIIDDVNAYRLDWKGEQLSVGVSIGIAIIDGDGADIAAIMRQADLACYVAKDSGRNRFFVVDRETITDCPA